MLIHHVNTTTFIQLVILITHGAMAFEELTDTIKPPVEASSSSRHDRNTQEVMDIDPIEPPSPLSGHTSYDDRFGHAQSDDNRSGIKASSAAQFASPLRYHLVDEEELIHLLHPAEQEELANYFNTVNYGEVRNVDKGKGHAVSSAEQEHDRASSSDHQGRDFTSPITDKTNERKDSQISNIVQDIEARHDLEARYDIEVKVTEVDDLSASPPESTEGMEGAVTVLGTSDTNNPVSRSSAFPH